MKIINKFKNIVLLLAIVLSIIPCNIVNGLSDTITTGTPNNISTQYIGQTYFAQKKLSDGSFAYCMDHTLKTPSEGLTYTKKANITDKYPGIIYILQNGYPSKKKASKYLTGNATKDYYITQGAIHWYVDRVNNVPDNAAKGTYSYQQLGSGFKITGQDTNGMRKYVKALVEDAIEAVKNNDYDANPKIELTNSSSLMVLDDSRQYWISKQFTVSTDGNTNDTYTVTIEGAPEGTIITDTDGNIKNIFNENDNFIIKTPTSSVTDDIDFIVKVSTSGTIIRAYQYTTTDKEYQDIAVIDPETKSVSDTYELTITNETTVSVKMAKTDTNGNYIAGAKLKYSGTVNNKTVSGTFTSTVEPKTFNLRTGNYCLAEVTPPSGYLLTTSKVCFDIDGSGHILDHDSQNEIAEPVVIKLSNTTNKIEIKKVDVSGNALAGAKLALYKVQSSNNDQEADSGTLIGEEWTSGTTAKVFEKLSPGWYAIVEKNAPIGYALANNVYFYVRSDGKIVKGSTVITSIEINNSKTVTNIHKTDITGTNEIEGAHLRVLNSARKVVDEWISKSTPHSIEGLGAGLTYTLEETIAPKGYALTSSIEFTVNEDGSITDVTLKNDVIRLTISKQDITKKQELPGAHLVIRKENSDIYIEWDSTEEEKVIEMIPVGTYTLEETTSPDGYVLNTEVITFVINEDGTITDVDGNPIDKVIMYNTPETPVPKTEANISTLVYILGILAISGGAYLLYNKKKLNNNK